MSAGNGGTGCRYFEIPMGEAMNSARQRLLSSEIVGTMKGLSGLATTPERL
jgi:hypothetical protein